MAIPATEILIEVIGGVALLLWGTRMVRTGFQRAYGADLRRTIRGATTNRFLAFLAGIGVTGLLQSSTATALMTASFAGRGLVGGAAALAVMLGADVGTTLVAQFLSLKLGLLSPLLILGGVVVFLTARVTRLRDLGRVAIGLGLMLLALRLIFGASAPMREADVVQAVVAALAGEPLLAVLIAGLLTWLAHSSLAMVLLVMSLAATGAVPLVLAFLLVLGANAGGAIPPLLVSTGPPARRVALGNLLFRLIGVAIAVPLVAMAAPHIAEFDPTPARQVVNFHTAFNLCLAVVFIGLTDLMAAVCKRILPDREVADDPSRPRYLDRSSLDEPTVALAGAAREALRMGDVVESMLVKSGEVLLTDDRKLLDEVEQTDDVVDALHEELKLFLAAVSRKELDDEQSRRCVELISFTTNMEHIGDIIDKNLMELAAKKIRNRLSFSDQGKAEIAELHNRVVEHMRLGFSVFLSGEVDMARRLLEEKTQFRDLERAAADNHMARLRSGRPETIETSSLHLDILRDLKRIHSHIASVAYPILEQAGELRVSRLKRPPSVESSRESDTSASTRSGQSATKVS